MGFSAQQNAFISTLAGHTGLNPGVVAAWVAAEEPVGASSGYRGTQDWLNVGITDSGPMGAGNSVWRDPVQAGVATANWIRGTWSDPGFGHAAPGIQAIIRTAGQAPGAQIRAIQNSGWASGGYSDLGQLYGTYAGQAPKPSGGGGAPAPAPAGKPQAGMPSSTGSAMVIPTTTFDKAGFTQAQRAYTAGTFLSQLDKSNPYNIPVKGEVQTSDPLLASGLLTTTAPDPAAFTSQSFKLAQNTLTSLAGGSGGGGLKVHPAVASNGQYVNPLPGFSIGRTDMGVDASATPGAPIRAIGDSKLVQVLPDWYAGQPLLLFQFLNGSKQGQYWYVSEQINPSTTQIGHVFHAGEPVAKFASSGTGIEIGYGSPTSNSRTLAGEQGNTGDASHSNAPAGVAFKQFLGSLH